ncbi:hypothetical protein BJ741DRAFT_393564 [Chytriomyces cf. hyalinus JEL632]|nr:hypothetical protein BJ741DRAFT_393564 [Chytriomyces cf. hyalinus JEL632]
MKPTEYLPYMIAINWFLEHHSRKTLNPTPLCTTYIPGSITLNTAAMVDIVFQDKSDFDGLRGWMARAGYDLSKFKGKGDLYSSVKKFLPNVNSSLFNTSLWQYVCRFHGRQHSKKKKQKKNREFGFLKYRAMIFKNMVTTDSHKAGIHFVNEEAYLLDMQTANRSAIGKTSTLSFRLSQGCQNQNARTSWIPRNTAYSLSTRAKRTF